MRRMRGITALRDEPNYVAYLSMSSSLTLRFISDATLNYNGFNASVRGIDAYQG